ncbi:hypothetical protein PsYK624_027000 [Phanerochaete sordida]|uniref:Uncharacterized protein n=1 Tax=Phanerochaete sordida TaxID=48140 RepID=A0A9P3L901_9APHY|nr:hypothetical protein PsYK624_027000 [Phanerochaete sordida]
MANAVCARSTAVTKHSCAARAERMSILLGVGPFGGGISRRPSFRFASPVKSLRNPTRRCLLARTACIAKPCAIGGEALHLGDLRDTRPAVNSTEPGDFWSQRQHCPLASEPAAALQSTEHNSLHALNRIQVS